MKKLSLLIAAVIVSTAMFANTPSGNDQEGKPKASKAQTLKKTKPLKKYKATKMTPKEEAKINKKK